MTGARRRRKARLLVALFIAGLAVIPGGGRDPAYAAPTGRVVTDALTGLALSGFDPVAYFADHKPRLGEGPHELIYRGAVWRFRNEGNRAAFARDPDVYAPRFGGYDPIALTRGVAVPGHPLIWLIAGGQLYLFSNLDNRSRFAAAHESSAAAAEHYWREVEPTLDP